MNEPTRNPLSWPLGWPRTEPAKLRSSNFSQYSPALGQRGRRDITISAALERLENEMQRLGATEPLLSSNLKINLAGMPYSGQGEPKDRGIAVYFKLKGKDRVLACDRYLSCAGNIAAIAAHIDALRRIERYGVGTVEQAFAGYAALPPPSDDNRPAWRATLGFRPDSRVTPEDVNLNYRTLAKKDPTNEHRLLDLNLAREAALRELSASPS